MAVASIGVDNDRATGVIVLTPLGRLDSGQIEKLDHVIKARLAEGCEAPNGTRPWRPSSNTPPRSTARTDQRTRRRFSEDLRNLTLAAPSVNRNQKRDHDAAGWLPPMNRCWFAARVINVKRAYDLTVDRRERDALARALAGCEDTDIDMTPRGTVAAASPPASRGTAGASGGTDALALYDDNGNGRITCAEARRHGIAPVPRTHPAYQYMQDGGRRWRGLRVDHGTGNASRPPDPGSSGEVESDAAVRPDGRLRRGQADAASRVRRSDGPAAPARKISATCPEPPMNPANRCPASVGNRPRRRPPPRRPPRSAASQQPATPGASPASRRQTPPSSPRAARRTHALRSNGRSA